MTDALDGDCLALILSNHYFNRHTIRVAQVVYSPGLLSCLYLTIFLTLPLGKSSSRSGGQEVPCFSEVFSISERLLLQ